MHCHTSARQVFTPDPRPNSPEAPDRHGRMRFARAFGGEGEAPGHFAFPQGVTVVRGLLVVSEARRLQVLTPKGVPLQVLTLGERVRGMCANEERVWVADKNQVLELKWK